MPKLSKKHGRQVRLSDEAEERIRASGEDPQRYKDLILQSYAGSLQRIDDGDVSYYIQAQWGKPILDDFQMDMINHVFNPEYHSVWIKGCTGSGKGMTAGLIAAMYFDIYPYSKVVITASNLQQAIDNVFNDCCKWLQSMRVWSPKYRVMTEDVRDSKSRWHFIKAVNPENIQSFAGQHSEHVCMVFDEATETPDEFFDLGNTQAKKVVALGNPRTLFGRFRDSFPAHDPDTTQSVMGQYGKMRCITVPGHECMNIREYRIESRLGPMGGIIIAPGRQDDAVKLMRENDKNKDAWPELAKTVNGRFFKHGESVPAEFHEHVKPLIPGQKCYDWFQSQLADKNPFNVLVYGLAKFPPQDPDKQLVMADWLGRHRDKWEKLRRRDDSRLSTIPPRAFGLDIGVSDDGDPCVLMGIGDEGVSGMLEDHHSDTPKITSWVLTQVMQHWGIDLRGAEHPIAVDVDGVGKGVAGELELAGCWVLQINGNASPKDRLRFGNLRAEGYGMLADTLNPRGPDGHVDFAIPDDNRLLEELCAPEKIPVGKDGLKFHITPKKELKKKLNPQRSPDRADTLVYAYLALMEVCEAGFVTSQLDTANFEPDLEWSAGLLEAWDPNAKDPALPGIAGAETVDEPEPEGPIHYRDIVVRTGNPEGLDELVSQWKAGVIRDPDGKFVVIDGLHAIRCPEDDCSFVGYWVQRSGHGTVIRVQDGIVA